MKTRLLLFTFALIMIVSMIPVSTIDADAATATYNFLWPVKNGKITPGRKYSSSHLGIDIVATNDNTIYSSVEGKVIRVFNSCPPEHEAVNGGCNHNDTWGNSVIVRCTGPDNTTYDIIYGHMKYNSIIVKENDTVKVGQPLGTIGNSGNSYGKHLHLEVRQKWNYRSTTINNNSIEDGGPVLYFYNGYEGDCQHEFLYKHDDNCSWLEPCAYHWEECSKCGYKKEKQEHNWDSFLYATDNVSIMYLEVGHFKECSLCGMIKAVEHTTKFKTEGLFHFKECTVCNYKSEKEMHDMDHLIKYNSEIHWVECKNCSYKEEQAHRLSLQPIHDNSVHWEKCDFCDYQIAVLHTLAITGSAEQHWHECSCGYISEKSNHLFVNANDSIHHWSICTSCQHTTNKEQHNYIEKSDSYRTWKECPTCGHKTEYILNSTDTETQTTSNTMVPDTMVPDTSISSERETKPYNSEDYVNHVFGCNSTLEGNIFLVLALISSVGVIISKKNKN